MKRNIKIGVIQNAPLTADFSANIRSIVQAYRDCLDRGAELVVAPAFSLTGPLVMDLSKRASFQQQNQRALEVLAREIAQVPLILASYSMPFVDLPEELAFTYAQSVELEAEYILCPFILEDGEMTQLEEGELTSVRGMDIYVEVGDEESAIDFAHCDLFVRLSTQHWYARSASYDDQSRPWEAQINACPVLYVNSVGYADNHVYAGGSTFYNSRGVALDRVAHFTVGQMIVTLEQDSRAKAAAKEEELLRQALVCCLKEAVHQHDYQGICLNIDLPNSSLLAFLAAQALGADRVHGVSFGDDKSQVAANLGICMQRFTDQALSFPAPNQLDAEASLAFKQRVQASLLTSYAEQEGFLLIAPLDRHQILLGEYCLFAEPCAKLLPFGELYQMDVYLLSQYLRTQGFEDESLDLPAYPEVDRILHALIDQNMSANELLFHSGDDLQENDVRRVQRCVLASAQNERLLPPSLHIESPIENYRFPISHRLND